MPPATPNQQRGVGSTGAPNPPSPPHRGRSQVAHAGDWYIQPTDIADPANTPTTARAAATNASAVTRTEVWDSGGAVGSTTVATSSQAITWSSATDYGVRSWMAYLIELTV